MADTGGEIAGGVCGICAIIWTSACQNWCDTKRYGSGGCCCGGGHAGCCNSCCDDHFNEDSFEDGKNKGDGENSSKQPEPTKGMEVPAGAQPATT